MGMRIRKKWDLLSEQAGALAILAVCFLLGGAAGGLFASLSGGAGAQELSSYLAGYLALASEEGIPRSLWPVLWGQLKFSLAALVLGLTGVGVIGLPALFGVRGFLFTFSVACFCRAFGGRGFFPAFLLFGLPALLWTPALFLMSVPGFLSAQRQLRRSLGEGGRGESLLSGTYWSRSGLCVGLSLAAGFLEFWVVPVLLRAAARVVL